MRSGWRPALRITVAGLSPVATTALPKRNEKLAAAGSVASPSAAASRHAIGRSMSFSFPDAALPLPHDHAPASLRVDVAIETASGNDTPPHARHHTGCRKYTACTVAAKPVKEGPRRQSGRTASKSPQPRATPRFSRPAGPAPPPAPAP